MGKLAKSRHRQNSGINRTRQRLVALNLAKGMNPEQAVIEAGYSPTTARKKAYQIIRHPVVQSLLTDSVGRVLAKENKKFDDIVRPYVKALDANMVVKMPSAGMAIQTAIVDHPTRMAAATHLIGLYRAKGTDVQEDDGGSKGPPIVYQIKFIESTKDSNHSVISRPIPQPTSRVAPTPQVRVVNGKR